MHRKALRAHEMYITEGPQSITAVGSLNIEDVSTTSDWNRSLHEWQSIFCATSDSSLKASPSHLTSLLHVILHESFQVCKRWSNHSSSRSSTERAELIHVRTLRDRLPTVFGNKFVDRAFLTKIWDVHKFARLIFIQREWPVKSTFWATSDAIHLAEIRLSSEDNRWNSPTHLLSLIWFAEFSFFIFCLYLEVARTRSVPNLYLSKSWVWEECFVHWTGYEIQVWGRELDALLFNSLIRLVQRPVDMQWIRLSP